MLGGKSAFGQGCTHLILGISREFLPDLLQTRILTRLDLLLKVSNVQIVAKLCLTGYRRNKSKHALQECSLSYTIGSCDSDLIAALHTEVHRF